MRTCTELHPMPREEPLQRKLLLPLKANSVHLLGMARNVLPGVWAVLHPPPNPQRRHRLRHRVTSPSACSPVDSREKRASFFLCDHCPHQFYRADEENAGLRGKNSQRMLKTELRDSGAGAGILPCCWRNKLSVLLDGLPGQVVSTHFPRKPKPISAERWVREGT